MSGRVRIGTCLNPADAALVRAMLSARGIHAVVGAERHASLLGPLGGGFLSLDIWVDADDADDAMALLRDFRERSASDDPMPDGPDDVEAADRADATEPDDAGDDADADADAADADADADDDADPGDRDGDAGSTVPARIERRRRTALVLLLGCCVTFGTGHMAAGAGARGVALAAVELLGLLYLWAGNALGLGVVVAAVVTDVVGALWIVHRTDRSPLPVARLRGS